MVNLDYISKQEKEIYLKLQQKIKYIKDLEYKTFVNAIVVPNEISSRNYYNFGTGGVCDESNQFLSQSKTSTFGSFYDYKEPVDYIDDNVVYCGPLLLHYGHIIADVLQYIIRASKIKNKHFVFVKFEVSEEESRNYSLFLEILKAFNIDGKSIYIVNKPTRFKSIDVFNVIDDLNAFIISPLYKNGVEKLINYAKRNIDFAPCKNILLSREFEGKTKLNKNIIKIENLFRNNGYKIISPEKMSLYEQIMYINSATNIVCWDGTLGHSAALFSNSQSNVIILKKRDYFLNRQMPIDLISNSNVIYVKSYLIYFNVVYVSTTKYLKRFAKNNLVNKKVNNFADYMDFFTILFIKFLKKIYKKTKGLFKKR